MDSCPREATLCGGACYGSVESAGELAWPSTPCDRPGEKLPVPTSAAEIQCLVDMAANSPDEVVALVTGYANKADRFETVDGSVTAPEELVGSPAPSGDDDRCVGVYVDQLKLGVACDSSILMHVVCEVDPVE